MKKILLMAMILSTSAYAENEVGAKPGLEKMTSEQMTDVYRKDRFKCYKEAVEKIKGTGKRTEDAQVSYTVMCLENLGWGMDYYWKK